LFTDEQLEQAIRRFQPKAGGRTPSFTVPEAMTDKDRGQKQWELEQLEDEINVWERPRSYNLPEGAVKPVVSEGPLSEEEKYARPMGPEGTWTPEFGRQTGIFMREDGAITNVGPQGDVSTPKQRGFEQDEATKQRYIEAIQKRNRLRQELAQDKAGVANIPGYGVFERGEEGKLGKRIAEAPTAGDWTKTREGATTLALLDKVGEGGKLNKAQEISFRNHHKRLSDQLATVQEPLLTGQIEGEGGINRPLTQEERQYFESQAEDIKGQMLTLESVMGGGGQGVDDAFEVKGAGGQDGYQGMMPQVTDRLNAIEKVKGREAAERVLGQVQRMIQNKRPPADIEQYLKDAATGVERQGAQREEPQRQPRQEKSPVDEGLMEVNAPAMPRPSRKPMMRPQGGEAGSVSASAARSQAMSTRSPQDIQRNRQRLDEAFGPDRVNQMTSDMDIGNPFTSAQKSMENIGGYFDRATTAVQGRRGRGVVPEDVQADRTTVLTKAEQVSPGAGQKIESALTKVFGGEYFDPNTQTIKPEAIPVLVQVARQLGLSDQQIQQIMGT